MEVVPTDRSEAVQLAVDADFEWRRDTPEQRLLSAVLERAVEDARAGEAAAFAWLESDDDTFGPGWSFVGVCHQLQADHEWIRAVALEYIAAHPYERRVRSKVPGVAKAA